jgi:cobalt-zinc-cadmium efflux system membrane fusion protein
VQPDISREVPIVSLANGRILALRVTLGQTVRKGQLLMEVQSSDVTAAFGNYLKAVSDERLAHAVLDRDTLLYSKGAVARSQVEIAQNAEDDAKAALTASEQQLHVLGVDKNNPGETVKIYSPVNGVVIQQNATASAPEGVNYSNAAPALTVADLSHVWVVCDVYENDLSSVRLGESAQIHLSAYPGKVLTGTVSDIGAVLDPNLRTAKVRIQVPNPGMTLRIGMFATASFSNGAARPQVVVPATAILHLHDRDWVFVPAAVATTSSNGTPTGSFRRVPVTVGQVLDGNQQVIQTGLSAGQQVVANALKLENAADQ